MLWEAAEADSKNSHAFLNTRICLSYTVVKIKKKKEIVYPKYCQFSDLKF
jgi:hypothetical protein